MCTLPNCFCSGDVTPSNKWKSTILLGLADERQWLHETVDGELSVNSQPQLVMLTFDDAVNDRNSRLYAELFERGRKNPNGCPIAATFYVSHEWSNYQLVRNLYADGHEIATHSIS